MKFLFRTAVACAAFGGAADAQDTTTTSDSAKVKLPAVTITGTRTVAKIIDVPLAITVIDRAHLRTVSGYGLDDALTMVPGALAQSRYGNNDVRIVIRGFGARGAGDRSNAGTSRGIRVMLDGFPETEPDGRTSFDLIDLASAERVDVVRSNASSVWGNAAGGVINVSSVPTFGRSTMSVQSMVGAYGLQRHVAQGATRLGNGTLFASFVNSTFDGWRAASSSRRALMNVGLVSPLGEHTRVGVFAVAANDLFHIPGPLTRTQADADPRQANATYQQRDERRHNRLGRLGVTLEHHLDERNELSGMLYVNPKYLQRSERGTFRDFTRYHLGGNLTYQNRTALTSSITSTLLAGTDEAYQDGAILFYALSPSNGRGATLRDNKAEGANNFGVFVQEQLGFGDHWSLLLGLRHDDISYYYRSNIDPRLDTSKSFRGLTPKVGAVYHVSPTQSFYANVGGGVEAPAGNETDPAGTFGEDTVTAINPLLEPIRSTTYELGTKHDLSLGDASFIRGLSYDAAVYLTDVRNEIVPYRGGRFYFTAGKARRKGAELGTSVRAAYGLSLQSAVTWSDNRYRDYVVDSVHYGKPGRLADYSDNKVVGVPDMFYHLELGYAPRLLRGAELKVGVENTGRYFADDANTITVPSFTTVNATLAFDRPLASGRGVVVRGFVQVRNLTNRRYIGSAFLNPDIVNGAPVAFEPGLPRSVIVSVTVGRDR